MSGIRRCEACGNLFKIKNDGPEPRTDASRRDVPEARLFQVQGAKEGA
jgi:hypothetical protein